MRLFDSATAPFAPEFGAQASRWETFGDLDHLPFGVMWCRVEPRASTAEDRHPERELMTVAHGSGTVSTAAGAVAVETGQTVLLDADEAHVITNRSGTDPLVVLSMYWLPEAGDPR